MILKKKKGAIEKWVRHSSFPWVGVARRHLLTEHAQSLIDVNGYMMTAQRHDNTNRVAKSNRKNV